MLMQFSCAAHVTMLLIATVTDTPVTSEKVSTPLSSYSNAGLKTLIVTITTAFIHVLSGKIATTETTMRL